jgi:hypothetical protein
MYTDGQVLGASTTTGVAVATLPLTAGNTVLQVLLVGTIIMAVTVLAVRIVRIASTRA